MPIIKCSIAYRQTYNCKKWHNFRDIEPLTILQETSTTIRMKNSMPVKLNGKQQKGAPVFFVVVQIEYSAKLMLIRWFCFFVAHSTFSYIQNLYISTRFRSECARFFYIKCKCAVQCSIQFTHIINIHKNNDKR